MLFLMTAMRSRSLCRLLFTLRVLLETHSVFRLTRLRDWPTILSGLIARTL
jgi:hypothetical protein